MKVKTKRAVKIGKRRTGSPIIGVALTAAELAKIPQVRKFTYAKAKRGITQEIVNLPGAADAEGGAGGRGAGSGTGAGGSRRYQCPIGREDVTVPVIAACCMGSAQSVAVECVNKHWARYPCKA